MFYHRLKASDVFRRLFVQGSPAEVESQLRKLAQGRSILDAVGGQARDLQRSVGSRDRDRLDQYFTSVRELEQRLQAAHGSLKVKTWLISLESTFLKLQPRMI